ncbi:hypothetical protein TNCV_4264311 [Trichonephila clavipes]|nr:hypothetical protein TNCV_4264311 [Trichonephila clavipes]
MGGHMDQGSHPTISHTSQSYSLEHMQMSRPPESLFSVNLELSVRSTEAYRCLVQEMCSLAQDKLVLLCQHTQLVTLHRDLNCVMMPSHRTSRYSSP